MSSIAFCVYYANMTLPCHSANELFAPTIPRSQQGDRQQTVFFIYSHPSSIFVPDVHDSNNMFLRTVGEEMCIIGEKLNAGCLYHQNGTVVDTYSSHWSAKNILSFYNLF